MFNAIDVRNNEKFAIKLIKDGYSAKLGLSSLLIREITIMNMLRDNPYIGKTYLHYCLLLYTKIYNSLLERGTY